ncbi:MAG: hypothetical protein HFE45_03170 [Oscillospiraceae bacterium]|jgi:hypothetical protein|nr:hypothetical protein [Oscillospiraceae bacterium]
MSILVFKQWLYQPNLKSTPAAVNGMLRYIATREGVVPNEEKEFHDRSRYVEYMAGRPGSTGLFGRLEGMRRTGDLNNLPAVSAHVRDMAGQKVTIFNAVISLTGEDAARKGFDERPPWEKFVASQMPMIAREMGLPLSSLEWCAAVHMEPDHPHVHLMYWDREQKIGCGFINPERSNAIRKKLTRAMFRDELKAVYDKKDAAERQALDENDRILTGAGNVFKGMTPAQIAKELPKPLSLKRIIDHRLAARLAEPAVAELIRLTARLSKEYRKGAYKYAYLPPELKAAVDDTVKNIMALHPEVQGAFDEYLKAVHEQAAFFGGESEAELLSKSSGRLFASLGNQVLKVCKALLLDVREAKQLERRSEYALSQGMLLFQRLCNILTSETEQLVGSGKPRKDFSELSQVERDEIMKKKNL